MREDLKHASAEGSAVEPVGGKVKGRDGKRRRAKQNKPAPRPSPPPVPGSVEAPAPIPMLLENPQTSRLATSLLL